MHPRPEDWGFPAIHFGPPTPPAMRLTYAPVDPAASGKLVAEFRKKLLEDVAEPPPELKAQVRSTDVLQLPPLIVTVELAPHAPLSGEIQRFNSTAARVLWVHRMSVEVGTNRRSGHVQAISMYLSGVDRVADNAVISITRQIKLAGKSVIADPSAFDKLLAGERPLAVQIFIEPWARHDPSIDACFGAMGAAFFGSLGVSGNEPNGH